MRCAEKDPPPNPPTLSSPPDSPPQSIFIAPSRRRLINSNGGVKKRFAVEFFKGGLSPIVSDPKASSHDVASSSTQIGNFEESSPRHGRLSVALALWEGLQEKPRMMKPTETLQLDCLPGYLVVAQRWTVSLPSVPPSDQLGSVATIVII